MVTDRLRRDDGACSDEHAPGSESMIDQATGLSGLIVTMRSFDSTVARLVAVAEIR